MQTIPCKTLLTTNKNSNWFGTEFNMNIYRGCSHGCIYCDSRSECYGNEGFQTVRAKENAIGILAEQLLHKKKKGVVGTGAMSDPYNPMEKTYRLTAQALELFARFSFGTAIATKSPLITRDTVLLQEIQRHAPVICKITITTADDKLCRQIEPSVAPTTERLEAIHTLSNGGIFTGILLMPILPFITDTTENIKSILTQAKAAGAKFAYPAFGVTLRDRQREYYYQQLEQLFPGLKEQYIQTYGNSYVCSTLQAKQLYPFFQEQCRALGLLYRMKDIIQAYKDTNMPKQLSFFP